MSNVQSQENSNRKIPTGQYDITHVNCGYQLQEHSFEFKVLRWPENSSEINIIEYNWNAVQKISSIALHLFVSVNCLVVENWKTLNTINLALV